MRLLILTQKVNKEDPTLGFVHNWITKLSLKFESIVVICLEKGEFDLPANVKVFSLGKEFGKSKIKYVKNFFNLILGLHKEYDSVFVHMNQEYIVLGGFLWKVMRKKVFLWRNHPVGGIFTRIAVLLSNKVFCTSTQSFTAKFRKTILMPAGIDTNLFCIDKKIALISDSILSIGRISPIKHIDKMIDIVINLHNKDIKFIFDIVGDPVNPEDYKYQGTLIKKCKNLIERGIINFIPAVSQDGAVLMYQSHKIFINLTPSGSLDKTILEAAACGCIPIVLNQTFKNIFDDNMLVSGEISDIENKIKFWLAATDAERIQASNKLQKYVIENHSLDALVEKLSREIKS